MSRLVGKRVLHRAFRQEGTVLECVWDVEAGEFRLLVAVPGTLALVNWVHSQCSLVAPKKRATKAPAEVTS